LDQRARQITSGRAVIRDVQITGVGLRHAVGYLKQIANLRKNRKIII
jgi:hypothetical protein